ncbi:MAG TPA: acetyl-coenzyme A synthetase N-terminal domain-containing protein, partial [Candidatus Binataceae bacterium]|nr:acetyl-coenzyme A synthetase N-terminal domain-containing protein [Candidatus Binataceae bacterium]
MDSNGHELGRDVAPIWNPSPDYVSGSHLERLMRAMGIDVDPSSPDAAYQQLYRRSIEDNETFWRKTLEEIGVEWFTPFARVVDASVGIQWPKWFPGGQLNLTHNALYRHLPNRAKQPAIVWEGEDGACVRLTYGELAREVSRSASALRK